MVDFQHLADAFVSFPVQRPRFPSHFGVITRIMKFKVQILTPLSGPYNVQVTLNILDAVLALHPQFSLQQ